MKQVLNLTSLQDGVKVGVAFIDEHLVRYITTLRRGYLLLGANNITQNIQFTIPHCAHGLGFQSQLKGDLLNIFQHATL